MQTDAPNESKQFCDVVGEPFGSLRDSAHFLLSANPRALGCVSAENRMSTANGMRFIDLFAGLGGFHIALDRLGHKCVFASELDPELRALYERNFGTRPAGDIREVPLEAIPEHEVLCAGCPCQPFSKAGEQHGLDCPKWGDLLEYVLRIARARKPQFLILENVPNLKRHNEGETWSELERAFVRAGYKMASANLSPHQFGVPQIRERVFIVGSRTGLDHFTWPTPPKGVELAVKTILDRAPADAKPLGPSALKCLQVWQRFLKRFPASKELPYFPIWTTEFGATYPYESTTPWAMPSSELRRYRGSHGFPLKRCPDDELLEALPSYARTEEKRFPEWKQKFIRLNRDLYLEHKRWIDEWLPEVIPMLASRQKLEWHCKGGERDIWKYVIQFRASGVRVKRPTTAPSLIAMTTTQVPIIAWERRYMTTRECARLQSLDVLTHLPVVETRAFKALGNAVNADVVALIASALLNKKHPRKIASRRSLDCDRNPLLLTHV